MNSHAIRSGRALASHVNNFWRGKVVSDSLIQKLLAGKLEPTYRTALLIVESLGCSVELSILGPDSTPMCARCLEFEEAISKARKAQLQMEKALIASTQPGTV